MLGAKYTLHCLDLPVNLLKLCNCLQRQEKGKDQL